MRLYSMIQDHNNILQLLVRARKSRKYIGKALVKLMWLDMFVFFNSYYLRRYSKTFFLRQCSSVATLSISSSKSKQLVVVSRGKKEPLGREVWIKRRLQAILAETRYSMSSSHWPGSRYTIISDGHMRFSRTSLRHKKFRTMFSVWDQAVPKFIDQFYQRNCKNIY